MSSFGDGFNTLSSLNNYSFNFRGTSGGIGDHYNRSHRDTTELERKLEKLEKDKSSLVLERDQALDDLRNVETAFSELHQ
jgi:hypothetical protein